MNIDNRADYAEFFESITEFSNEKIPLGTSVVLVEDKIRPAMIDEIPFGVISSFPLMVGNLGAVDSGTSWGGKYLKDEFGNYLTEQRERWVIHRKEKSTTREKGWCDEKQPPKGAKKQVVLIKKLNPDYDETRKYISRKQRPEWNMVALIGKVKILKGQPVSPNWIKLKDISDKVEEWLIK